VRPLALALLLVASAAHADVSAPSSTAWMGTCQARLLGARTRAARLEPRLATAHVARGRDGVLLIFVDGAEDSISYVGDDGQSGPLIRSAAYTLGLLVVSVKSYANVEPAATRDWQDAGIGDELAITRQIGIRIGEITVHGFPSPALGRIVLDIFKPAVDACLESR
jgi:hypothetical protein